MIACVVGLIIVFVNTTTSPSTFESLVIISISASDQVTDSPFFIGPLRRFESYSDKTEEITLAFGDDDDGKSFPLINIGLPSRVLTRILAKSLPS